MTSAARSVHKHSARRCAEVDCSQWTWCVLGDCVDAGYPQRRRLVASEQPCRAFYIEHDRVTTGAGGVNADGLYVAQRAEDVGFEQVRMSVKGRVSVHAGLAQTMTHSESSVLPPRSLRPSFGLPESCQHLKLYSLVTRHAHAPVGSPRDQNWARA